MQENQHCFCHGAGEGQREKQPKHTGSLATEEGPRVGADHPDQTAFLGALLPGQQTESSAW